MTTKPEALRLAHWLERDGANCQQHIDAASELRRLHEENELLAMACDKIRVMHREEIKPLLDVHSLNLELLEALKRIKETGVYVGAIAQEMMDSAIKKAEGTE